jgi:hypothetical protein
MDARLVFSYLQNVSPTEQGMLLPLCQACTAWFESENRLEKVKEVYERATIYSEWLKDQGRILEATNLDKRPILISTMQWFSDLAGGRR